MVTGTSERIYLTSPALVPRLLPTSCGWPRGLSPTKPSSYEVVSLADLGSAHAVPYMIGLLKAVWGQARLHEGDPGCTSVTVTRAKHCVLSEVPMVVVTNTQLFQLFV